jgi:hypothetical protein
LVFSSNALPISDVDDLIKEYHSLKQKTINLKNPGSQCGQAPGINIRGQRSKMSPDRYILIISILLLPLFFVGYLVINKSIINKELKKEIFITYNQDLNKLISQSLEYSKKVVNNYNNIELDKSVQFTLKGILKRNEYTKIMDQRIKKYLNIELDLNSYFELSEILIEDQDRYFDLISKTKSEIKFFYIIRIGLIFTIIIILLINILLYFRVKKSKL